MLQMTFRFVSYYNVDIWERSNIIQFFDKLKNHLRILFLPKSTTQRKLREAQNGVFDFTLKFSFTIIIFVVFVFVPIHDFSLLRMNINTTNYILNHCGLSVYTLKVCFFVEYLENCSSFWDEICTED